MPALLLELFSEEIPAGMQARAADDLKRRITDGLKEARLGFGEVQTFFGPRRIALAIGAVEDAQPDLSEEKKGPKVGAPDKAIDGFVKSNGLSSIDEAEVRTLEKGDFYFVVKDVKGRPAAEVLKELIEAVLPQVAWPKSMRWADNPTRWVRPLHSLLCIFGDDVIPVAFAGLVAGNTTRGHRFLAPVPFAVTGLDDYLGGLKSAHVISDAQERAELIKAQATTLAEEAGLVLREDPGLLAEVAGLVDWPTSLMGTIDEEFMEVPAEVLVSAMRKHQKYFALETKDGALANKFIVVSNMLTPDDSVVVSGNERVLKARLADAKFFWDLDRKSKLESRVEALKDRIFQADLGTDHDRMLRIAQLARALAAHVPGTDAEKAARAALLCKADLPTGMVGEFPDLQGVMGRYYALHDGEDPEVAEAIAAHYRPAGPSDAVPDQPLGIVIALADKFDTLAGFFAIGQKPTGSKDPYALRRAAIGIIRIILDNKLRLSLRTALTAALAGHGKADADDVVSELMAFFADRLKVHLKDEGIRHDLINAVLTDDQDDLLRIVEKAEALAAFLITEDGSNLLTAYRRAANIVRIEEKNDGQSHQGDLTSADLLEEDSHALYTAALMTERRSKEALENEDDEAAMSALASLRLPLDIFFDNVTVNVDDPELREARLRLLARIGRAVEDVADFSKLEG